MKFSVVTTSCSSEREALKMADALLKKKLAACVKYSGAQSSFWWNGKVSKSKEFVLTAMTTKKNVPKVMQLIKKLHSYDVPEIIETDVKKGDKKYLEWVMDVTE